MREPCTTIIVSLPASEAASACIHLYENCAAFWAAVASDEEVAALQSLIQRKEAGDAQS
jgi:hypothetical protein